jgi:D-glucosaminate-6-phosphate ammonia-lyase
MFVRGDYDELLAGYSSRLNLIAKSLAAVAAQCKLLETPSECLPLLEIAVDEKALGRTAVEVCGRLRAGTPPCYVGHWSLDEGKLIINPLHLDDARANELARRLREELTP